MIEIDPTTQARSVDEIKQRVRQIIKEHNHGGAWRIYGLDFNNGWVALLGMTSEDSGARVSITRDTEQLWRNIDRELNHWEKDSSEYKNDEMSVIENEFPGDMTFSMING